MNSDTPPDVFHKTAQILADVAADRDIRVLIAAVRYLQERDGDVTRETLAEALPNPLQAREAVRLIRHLRNHQYIGPNARISQTDRLHQLESLVTILQSQKSAPETDVTATVPDDNAINAAAFGNLLTDILEVIKQTESDLWLVSPFLSDVAFDRLKPALGTAAQRGAHIRLVTRYLTYGGDDGDHNRSFARTIAEHETLGPQTTLYEYVDTETWETFHAKIVLADKKAAYVGTANATGPGFLQNLEVGVIFRDETVADLNTLVTSLLQSAHLHEVECLGTGFLRSSCQ